MKAYFLALVIALGLFSVGPFVQPSPSDGPVIKLLDHGTE
ncbi:hypothetical protein Elgi_56130 [Paenibacillus elgii]|nr:hypothetical protein Elgi_56130 [Paenibacillus elgii]